MYDTKLLVATLVELADILVDDFHVAELLELLVHRCVEILQVDAAGLMLAPAGVLQVMAYTSDAARNLELFQERAKEGPCQDCYLSGKPVISENLEEDDKWPTFAPHAIEAGVRAVLALPMRLRGSVIGALNLFSDAPGAFSDETIFAGQALTGVATIAVLQHRALVNAETLSEQLTHALESRVILEQAKGRVSERLDIPVGDAFDRLRGHARSHSLRIADVAAAVAAGELPAEQLTVRQGASRPARDADPTSRSERTRSSERRTR